MLPKKNEQLVRTAIESRFGSSEVYFFGKELRATISEKFECNQILMISDIELFIKPVNNYYVVTQLSKTKNANVIFSIDLKKTQDVSDLKLFERSL